MNSSPYFDTPASTLDDDEWSDTRSNLAKVLSPLSAEALTASAANNPAPTGVRTVVRDLNGRPAGSPLSALAGSQPGVARSLAAQLSSGSGTTPPQQTQPVQTTGARTVQQLVAGQPRLDTRNYTPNVPARMDTQNYDPRVQPSLTPASAQPMTGISNPPDGGAVRTISPTVTQTSGAQPMMRPGLAGQFQRQMQNYQAGPGPAQYAASQTPVRTDPANPDPNASLRPGGLVQAGPQQAIATGAQLVQAPSQMDRDQARLDYLKRSGSGIDQIQNGGLRKAARVGDALLSTFLPGAAPFVGGSTARHQLLLQQQQGVVNNDQAQAQQAAQLADTQSQTQQRQALADKADRYDPNSTKTVETADGVMGFNPTTGKYDQKIGDSPSKLNKYQVITAGDGTMFRIDPANPTSAEPITGPDGKQLTGKQESKYVQLERGGVEHTIEIGAGGKQTDLGPTGQKPMHVSVNGGGTWALDEDKSGKPILFNSKTGETKDAPDIQKAGTAAKAQAAIDKVNEPVDAAMNYANDYLSNSRYTGSGDEALQEKFFELAKPSVGFRMTQPQIDLLQNSRSWMNSAAAHLRHATKGTWFSDDQRKEIVQTMKDLAASKKKGGGGAQPAASAKPGGFNWSIHPKVQP